MKKIAILFAVSTLMLACSSSQNTVTETPEKTKEVEKTGNSNPDRDSRGYYLK